MSNHTDKHSNIRAFLALPLTEEMRKKISSFVKELKSLPRADKIRWVPSPNLHLTLHFFGQFPIQQLPEFASKLDLQIKQLPCFDIQFKKLMTLPHALAFQVELAEDLASLYRSIQVVIAEAGFAPETRPFLPHVTIGRYRDHFNLWPDTKTPSFWQQINQLHFYQSRSNDQGPIYEILQTFKLCNSET